MFGLTDKILAIVAGIGCIVLAGLLLVQTGALHKAERRADKAEMVLADERTLWADERTRAAEALAEATTKARETEQQLTAQAEKAEHEKQTQIAAVSARADDLRKRLRNAEASAATARLVSGLASASATVEVARVCHGSELSGNFGEQLVSEAERADKIRLQLAACERQYEAAREALN